MPPHNEHTYFRTTEAIDTRGGRRIKSYGSGRARRLHFLSAAEWRACRRGARGSGIEKGANGSRAALPCRSSLTHFLPSSPPLYSFSTSLRTRFDTSDQSPGDTGRPHSSLSSSSNNYGDRVRFVRQTGAARITTTHCPT